MVQAEAAVHRLVIPDWRPTPLNRLLRHWATAAHLKRVDREMVMGYAIQAGIPKATTRRRVRLVVTLPKGRKAFDPDAPWKGVLDGLVHTGLLVDDSAKWVELAPVEFRKGDRLETTIELEDL